MDSFMVHAFNHDYEIYYYVVLPIVSHLNPRPAGSSAPSATASSIYSSSSSSSCQCSHHALEVHL